MEPQTLRISTRALPPPWPCSSAAGPWLPVWSSLRGGRTAGSLAPTPPLPVRALLLSRSLLLSLSISPPSPLPLISFFCSALFRARLSLHLSNASPPHCVFRAVECCHLLVRVSC
eukprot:jgi/Mesen1/8502/ME000480S07860